MDWDQYFFQLATVASRKSKDRSTRLGVAIVRNNDLVTLGFNDMPRGVCDDESKAYEYCCKEHDRLDLSFGPLDRQVEQYRQHITRRREDRTDGYKYHWVEHAERNAIMNAARLGLSTIGCTMHFSCGGLPCTACTRAIIQAGITELVMIDEDFEGVGKGTHYDTDSGISEVMLNEAGVTIRRISRERAEGTD